MFPVVFPNNVLVVLLMIILRKEKQDVFGYEYQRITEETRTVCRVRFKVVFLFRNQAYN